MSQAANYTDDEIEEILEKFWHGDAADEMTHNGGAYVLHNDGKTVGVVIWRQVEGGINLEKLVIRKVRMNKSVKFSGWDDTGRNLGGKARMGWNELIQSLEAIGEDVALDGPGGVYDYFF